MTTTPGFYARKDAPKTVRNQLEELVSASEAANKNKSWSAVIGGKNLAALVAYCREIEADNDRLLRLLARVVALQEAMINRQVEDQMEDQS